jgi:ADP-ribosylglycohydrolase/tetratricopeptide (TPR) repeat protein
VSIFEETGQGRSVTQDRSLRLFTNRHELSRAFARRLNVDSPDTTVMFLYGLGGNGKSLLLRHFETRCCYRLSPGEWKEISSYADEYFVDAIANAPSAKSLPVAHIDFGARPVGENRPQEALAALFMLKRQLADHRLSFPQFDFAAIVYLHKSGLEISKRLEELFPATELDFAMEVARSLLDLPVLRIGLNLLDLVNRHFGDALKRRSLQLRVSAETAAEILSLPPEPDLADELPRYFAEDLGDALAPTGKHHRVVLMFDTHEAFFGEGVADDPDSLLYAGEHARDEWFRSLLGHLDLGRGIVAVVAGRIRPRWAKATRARIPERFVDYRAVGPLAAADADEYLAQAGIGDQALRDVLVEYASAGSGEIHPYFLGLCADVALAASSRGSSLDHASFSRSEELAERERDLAGRLLVWVTPEVERSIVAVSACRSFDLAIFRVLSDRLDFPAQRSDFAKLVSFSFVAPVEGVTAAGEDTDGYAFAIHRILRRVLQHARRDATLRAHQVLAAHYREQALSGDFTAHVEEIYHRNQLDPAAGVAEWVAAIDGALAIGRFDRCRSLVALLADLQVDTEPERQECLHRVARAELALGRLSEVERILADLPPGSPFASLLQADVAFVRGELAKAETLALASMEAVDGPSRLPFMFRLAEIQLYRGRFPEAARQSEAGLKAAGLGGDVNQICRWQKLLGEVEYFAGDVAAATERFHRARGELEALPEAVRDQALLADLFEDVALVTGTLKQPDKAVEAQRAALEIRRRIGDARGVASSLHGMGRAYFEMGEHDQADSVLAEAARLAGDLGEGILLAKIWMAMADVQAALGRLDQAERLVKRALEDFERHGSPTDASSALIELASLRARQGNHQAWLRTLDRARQVIEQGGYLVQYQRFPAAAIPPPDRLLSGMLAYAAGDALGVPWEGKTAGEVDAARLDELPARDDWPRGATSDDTEQMLLVAGYLGETGGEFKESEFLERLVRAAPTMRGIGPTTSEAIRRYQQTHEVHATGGDTNGAVMRVLPVGWAVPAFADDRRRELATRLSEVTHGAGKAVGSACVVAAMASWASEGCPVEGIIQAALDELDWFEQAHQEYAGAFGPIRAAADGRFQPGPDGLSLDAVEMVAAVIHVLRAEEDVAVALRQAVSLGGDTDTVAAIVGGLLGSRSSDVARTIPWLARVGLPPAETLADVADGLHRVRRSLYA